MLQAYRQHAAERAALGIPPLPLDAKQTEALVELLKADGIDIARRAELIAATHDLDAVRAEVDTWFTPESLTAAMGPADTETEQIARAWLAKAGKRWRSTELLVSN